MAALAPGEAGASLPHSVHLVSKSLNLSEPRHPYQDLSLSGLVRIDGERKLSSVPGSHQDSTSTVKK